MIIAGLMFQFMGDRYGKAFENPWIYRIAAVAVPNTPMPSNNAIIIKKHSDSTTRQYLLSLSSCRGILVNLKNVAKTKGYEVVLKNGTSVPLSQKRVAQFKERLISPDVFVLIADKTGNAVH